MQPQEILKKYFGYDSFRHRQREAVDNILSGRDVLCVSSCAYHIFRCLSDCRLRQMC